MSEKKVRNKFKDVIWDYYLTNREVTKENDKYNKENPQKGWKLQEKVLICVIIVGVMGIIIRYFIL